MVLKHIADRSMELGKWLMYWLEDFGASSVSVVSPSYSLMMESC